MYLFVSRHVYAVKCCFVVVAKMYVLLINVIIINGKEAREFRRKLLKV